MSSTPRSSSLPSSSSITATSAKNPWIIALLADEGWLYDKIYLKYLIIPALVFYCTWVMTVPATQDPIYSDDSNSNKNVTSYLYVSPEGVRMELNQPLDKTRLLGHSIAGVVMIFCSLIQKHSGKYMLRKMLMQGEQQKGDSTITTRGEPSFSLPLLFSRYAHKNVTSMIMLGCITIMSTAGFIMRSYSNLPHFSDVMYLFVSPWIILGLLIYFTAKFRFCRLHVVIGNALVWSCFAVVFARVLGAGLQRLTPQVKHELLKRVVNCDSSSCGWLIPDSIVGLGDATGYYSGIAFATVFFGIFLSVETFMYFRRCSQLSNMLSLSKENNKKKKKN